MIFFNDAVKEGTEKLLFRREDGFGSIKSDLTSLVAFRMPNGEAVDLVTGGGLSSRI